MAATPAPAPAPAAAPAAPTSTLATSNTAGALPQMWVPCLVFAHLFAFYFLLRMVMVTHPKAWADIKRALRVGGGRRGGARGGHGHGGGSDAERRRKGHSGGSVAMVAAAGSAAAAKLAPAGAAARGGKDAGGGAGGDDQLHDNPLWRDAGDVEAGGAAEQGDGVDGASSTTSEAGGEPASPSARSQVVMRRLTTAMRPLAMDWRDLGCSYATPAGVKTVLKGVWGKAAPGDMVALMGPSGAGKSTCLDILAGRKSIGHLTGVVLVNGRPRRSASFARRTAYVPQDDNFLPTMTVGETSAYYATLTLPRTLSRAARASRVREVLAAMGLGHAHATLVGGTLPGGIVLRGLSGGERKRLSIATGIMSTPSIVFLDEPTSGLDSFAALSVMGYMRTLARGGQTVVSTIHQPRAAIWSLFDTTLLLSMGRMMYFGARDGLVPWFSDECGYRYEPAMHGLASDWVMDLVNIGFRKPESLFGRMMNAPHELDGAAAAFRKRYLAALPPGEAEATTAAAAVAAAQQQAKAQQQQAAAAAAADAQHGSLAAAAEAAIADAASGGNSSSHHHLSPAASRALSAVTPEPLPPRRTGLAALLLGPGGGGGSEGGAGPPAGGAGGAPWHVQFGTLVWREFLAVTRNPADVAGRCLIFTWLALFVGLIFYNLSSSVDALRARLNVLFVEPVILLLLPYVYMSLYTSDKQYYIADVAAKLYKPSAYYAAKQVAVLPFAVLNTLLFSFILYGLAGLRHDAASVGMNGLMSVLMYLTAAQVLTFAAVVTPNQDVAFMMAIGWTAVNLLMSNFMVRYVDMTQGWLSQLRYISAMGYAFEGYAQAEFAGLRYSCAGGVAPQVLSTLPRFFPNTPRISSPFVLNSVNNPGPNCAIDLDAILGYFSLSRPFWMTCVILAGYLGFFHLLTYGGFLWLTKKERR